MKRKVLFTRAGRPALWESGGGASTTGRATIICAPNGSPLRPYYVRSGGHLSCGDHALVPADRGNVIVEVARRGGNFAIDVYVILDQAEPDPEKMARGVDQSKLVEVDLLATFKWGEWDNPSVAAQYEAAIEAAKKKSRAYHCRWPVYVQENSPAPAVAPAVAPAPAPAPAPAVVPAPAPAPAPARAFARLNSGDDAAAVVETISPPGGRADFEVKNGLLVYKSFYTRVFPLTASGMVEFANYILQLYGETK